MPASCGKRPISSAELRAITRDLVSAAQKVTERKAEIAVRPEMESIRGRRSQLVADDIYITLVEPSKRVALEHALDRVARRYGLVRIPQASDVGIARFDYELEGRRTHSIRIITALAEHRPAQSSRAPQLAIILDDLGNDRAAADALLNLPFPLTVSILPNRAFSTEVAEEAHRRGDEVLLHLPMESESQEVPNEDVELRVGMSQAEVSQLLDQMLGTVPHVVGVNNHEGSRATADPGLMGELMSALRGRHLFFIDSRTTPATVAFDTAERLGIRSAYRNIFLDDVPTREAVEKQLELAARDASRTGSAIAIGHPHPATLAALEEELPWLGARGIRLVFASALVR